ncbi:hypothetical protein QUF70_21145, partial [Desulfobacterales bacterium HSG17]|nr:hypothetical protein [Desulfobacterales bacterium HSG17]
KLNSHVDLAVNYDMDNQSTDRVRIKKVDYLKNLLVMYQPSSARVRKGQNINISVLYLKKERISLFGKVLHAESNFFYMQYKPEIVLINLRRCFRENPSILFDINGKIETCDKERFVSESFILQDLSINGVGFLSNDYKWDKDFLNKKLNVEGKIHLNCVNKKNQFIYTITGIVNLVRVIQTSNGFIEGYEFCGKKSDDISKIVMDSQIAHQQAETKYYG